MRGGSETGHTFESIQCTALPFTQIGMVNRMSGVLCMPACFKCTWGRACEERAERLRVTCTLRLGGCSDEKGGMRPRLQNNTPHRKTRRRIYRSRAAQACLSEFARTQGRWPARLRHTRWSRVRGRQSAPTSHLRDLLHAGPAVRIALQAVDYVATKPVVTNEVGTSQHGGDVGHAAHSSGGHAKRGGCSSLLV